MQHSAPNERHPLLAFILELWATGRAALNEFVWADLRDGLLDLNGLSRPVRATIWLGFAFTAMSLVLLTQAPTLRAYFPLHTSVTPAPGRGLHIPLVLFPLSLFLLTLAWTYLIVGARQSHWLIRLGVLSLYSLTCANWLATLLASNPWSVAVGCAFYVAVLGSALWPGATRLRPSFYFALTLLCVGGLFATAQYPLVLQDQASGLPIGKTILEGNVRSLATLAIPLLILIGLDIADFTLSASTWIGDAVTRRLPKTLLAILTFALLAWLVWQGFTYYVSQQAAIGTFGIVYLMAGTFGLLLLLCLAWSTLARFFPFSSPITLSDFASEAGKVALILVLAFLLPLLAAFVFLEFAQLIQTIAVELQSGFFGNFPSFDAWASKLFVTATHISTTVYLVQPLWQRLCAAAAIMVALFLYRRGHAPSAHYASTAGITYLWVEITRPGQWLQSLGWTSPHPIVFAWLVLLIVMLLFWLWRKQLSVERLHRVFIILLLLILLRQTSLIASPLDPIFSLAGVGYLAVGLGWDLLTAGYWANTSSTALPRTSRIFLYLGYIILTVMLVNWAVASHDFILLERFTGEAAITGLSLLGYPFLYASIYLLLTNPLAQEDIEN